MRRSPGEILSRLLMIYRQIVSHFYPFDDSFVWGLHTKMNEKRRLGNAKQHVK